ncbi:prepilin-type N-terminal cleavage/methylation domain-containing protein [Patescibacteria group bacterium]|nr:prepilin-type N-terminal cleavage/methylation domain-containing protein [Patescibacteria group bacterium]
MLLGIQNNSRKKGFTLIELLLVIAIIAILAATIFVALDPLTRFQDSRDSRRWSDANSILSAIKIDQIDNRGKYLDSIRAIPAASSSEVFMISNGAVMSGCASGNAYCDTPVTDDDNCVDLSGLVAEGYMPNLPVGPDGDGSWSASTTGFTLQKSTQGYITIRACESEHSDEISVQR